MDQIDATVAFNPFEPGYAEDPYAQFAALRAADPVHASPLGVWMLFAYDDIHRLLREPGLSVEDRHAHPTPLTELAASVRGGDGSTERGNLAMLNRDPPDHTRLRRLVSKAFTPRTIQQLRPRVQALVDSTLDEAERQGGLELISQFAFTLPFAVITELLGMPDTDTDQLRSWSGTLVRSLEPVVDADTLRAIDAAAENMYGLISEAIAAKRQAPADDLLSALIAAEENGDVLHDDELAEQVMLLYLAGHETTVNLIGNGVLALLRHPDQLAALRADPELATNAVDELLRYDSPVQMTRRVTLTETAVGGHVIEAGAFVVLAVASANRDPAHFGPDAGRLDLARADAGEHLSFGGGHHYCLGASLARLEGQVAIGSLVGRFGRIEATAEPVWNGRINLRGIERLPLTVSR
ncbi:MAG TPA: cytochrome P450 [Acidimicrobiales bacterium]|nr:cytochrome P450 [Acidimicrobiales bacterium]